MPRLASITSASTTGTDAHAALNEGERRVLALLATGHTAKSIAAELDLSVNAVNERLREARRKTGAASSRELARSLAPQENRDKQIGVGGATMATAATGTTDAAVWRRIGPKELAIMSVAVIALTAAATFTQQQLTSDRPAYVAWPTVTRAALDRIVSETPESAKQLLAEGRDPAWADAAQRRLADLYRSVPGVGPVTIVCGRTLCQVETGFADRTRGVVESPSFLRGAVAAGFSPDPKHTVASRIGGKVLRALWQRAD